MVVESLEGQNVLVLGGSDGMGYATAAHLLRSKANVTITGRTADKLERARQRLIAETGAGAGQACGGQLRRERDRRRRGRPVRGPVSWRGRGPAASTRRPAPTAAHARAHGRGAERADATLLVDALPTPREAQSLRKVANALRFEPVAAADGVKAVYSIAPIQVDDGRFALKKNRVNAR